METNAQFEKRIQPVLREIQTKQALGEEWWHVAEAAKIIATLLHAPRLPRGVSRTGSQFILTNWLPKLPARERAQVMEIIEHIPTSRIGRTLAALVKAHFAG